MKLPRGVSVNANHRRYENRTLNFGLGYAMDFLASTRQWLRVVDMNDRGVILLKRDSDEGLFHPERRVCSCIRIVHSQSPP